MQPSPRTPSESPLAIRVMPGVSIGTRNAVTPRPRSPGCVAAKTTIDIGGLGVGDPDLAAVNHVAVVVEAGDGLLIGGIGAGVLLRQREGADRLARRERAQPALLLRVAAELGERLGDERVVDDGNHRDRGAGAWRALRSPSA